MYNQGYMPIRSKNYMVENQVNKYFMKQNETVLFHSGSFLSAFIEWGNLSYTARRVSGTDSQGLSKEVGI